MEKRIGTVTVLVKDRAVAPQVNAVISQYADIILARQGLPFRRILRVPRTADHLAADASLQLRSPSPALSEVTEKSPK